MEAKYELLKDIPGANKGDIFVYKDPWYYFKPEKSEFPKIHLCDVRPNHEWFKKIALEEKKWTENDMIDFGKHVRRQTIRKDHVPTTYKMFDEFCDNASV